MTLELNRLTGQVDAMGEKLARAPGRDRQRSAQKARELLAAYPEVTDDLRAKIEAAREYRRVAPRRDAPVRPAGRMPRAGP